MTGRVEVRFHDDPLRGMARWAAKRYRLGRIDVVFRDKIIGGRGWYHGSGCTYYPPDSCVIELSLRRTVFKLVQVLAHELAHVKARPYGGHGPAFYREFKTIVTDWNRHVEELRKIH